MSSFKVDLTYSIFAVQNAITCNCNSVCAHMHCWFRATTGLYSERESVQSVGLKVNTIVCITFITASIICNIGVKTAKDKPRLITNL